MVRNPKGVHRSTLSVKPLTVHGQFRPSNWAPRECWSVSTWKIRYALWDLTLQPEACVLELCTGTDKSVLKEMPEGRSES